MCEIIGGPSYPTLFHIHPYIMSYIIIAREMFTHIVVASYSLKQPRFSCKLYPC